MLSALNGLSICCWSIGKLFVILWKNLRFGIKSVLPIAGHANAYDQRWLPDQLARNYFAVVDSRSWVPSTWKTLSFVFVQFQDCKFSSNNCELLCISLWSWTRWYKYFWICDLSIICKYFCFLLFLLEWWLATCKKMA